jgi:hypothetical protein
MTSEMGAAENGLWQKEKYFHKVMQFMADLDII